ncbi:hypothetical protein RDABS01_010078 [Bienertia sinuspersici]
MQGLNQFKKASGLRANNAKSEVFSANMDREDVAKICARTCFKEGSWPFRYLGVPICNRRMSRDECEVLVHRMTARILCWQSKHISFAGRLQLVNAVLMSICNYWMQIVLLPTGVIKDINRVCRKFLWDGHVQGQKPGYVAWDQVCKSKSKGGLGIKDLCLWNTLAVGKIVRQIAKKKDSLWVKWVHVVYIKKHNWWEYQPSILASWVRRNICTAKKRLVQMNTDDWWPTDGKVFKIGRIYNNIKNKEEKVPWAAVTWNRASIPKHCFIWWLVVQRRLMVKKRLFNYGICSDSWCVLCGSQEETHDHLFFKCSFSQVIWRAIINWVQVTGRWSKRRCRTSGFRRRIIIAICAAVIYCICQARNQAYWECRRQSSDHCIVQIKYFVSKRCIGLCNKKCNARDRSWLIDLCR